jgi:hypothetical protein
VIQERTKSKAGAKRLDSRPSIAIDPIADKEQ